jgi:hypothetical protein
MDDRLDDAQIGELQAWAGRLAADGDEERRAAGKAILLLIAEIERTRVDVAPPEPEPPEPADEQGEPSVERTLRSRLSRIRARSSARQGESPAPHEDEAGLPTNR